MVQEHALFCKRCVKGNTLVSQVRLAEALAAGERLAAAEAEALRQRAAAEESAGRSGIS